jgi:hypothetical protein
MIINSVARRSLFVFGWLSCAIVTLSVVMYSEISIVFPVLMSAICMFSIDYFTRQRRNYYLPVIWTIYFILGYVLCLSFVLINSDAEGVFLFKSNRMAEFSNENFLPVFYSILSGMAGIFLAVVFCERFFKNNSTSITENRGLDTKARPRRGKVLIWTWCIASLGIIIIMGILGIGRTGLPHATVLPFKMTGILVYIKQMVIPFFGFLIFLRTTKEGNIRDMLVLLSLMVVVGAIGSVVFISRSFIIFLIIGPLLYIYFSVNRIDKRMKLIFVCVAITAAILLVTIPIIQEIRNIKYGGYDVSASKLLFSGDLLKFDEAVSQIISLFLGRIIGIPELVGVHALMENDMYAPMKVFFGNHEYTHWLQFEMYGFRQDPSGDTAFGYAFGLWGMMYLSGSNLVVLVGTSVFAIFIIFFEELFSRYGRKPLALFIALQFGTWIWGGIDLFLISRLVITAFACIAMLKMASVRRCLT